MADVALPLDLINHQGRRVVRDALKAKRAKEIVRSPASFSDEFLAVYTNDMFSLTEMVLEVVRTWNSGAFRSASQESLRTFCNTLSRASEHIDLAILLTREVQADHPESFEAAHTALSKAQRRLESVIESAKLSLSAEFHEAVDFAVRELRQALS